MADRVLRGALVAAACAHAGVAGALLAVRVPGTRAPEPPEELVVIAEEGPAAPAASSPPAPAEIAGARAAPGAMTRAAGAVPAPPAREDAPPHPDVETAPASSGVPWSFGGTAPLALSVDGYWKSLVLAGSARAAASPEPSPDRARPAPSPDRILRDGLDARDRALGLGAAGALVTAAHDAASPSIAPDVGREAQSSRSPSRTARATASAFGVSPWTQRVS